MSIQWTIVAGVMYAELIVTVILLIPFISPQRWNLIFKSKFLKSIGAMGHIYFKVFLVILVLFFMDAIREMRKYTNELDHSSGHEHSHLDADMQAHMRLFRSQRNFYISGFSLFLWFVLKRLATLISTLAVSKAGEEAAMKQAKSASAVATQLIGTDKKSEKKSDEDDIVQKIKDENRKLEAKYTAALKQATSVNDEYDRLMKEHENLQKEMKKLKNESGGKKDD